MKPRYLLFISLLFVFVTRVAVAQTSNVGCLGCNYDKYVVHASDPLEDWILRDVQHTDKYTILVIDIYSLDNKSNWFVFYQASYITVKNLTGLLHPVKWEVGGVERPLDDKRFFPENSKGKYVRNKLYFPRIPTGYKYFSFNMYNFIRWEDIYTDNTDNTKQTVFTEQSLREQWNHTGCFGLEGIYQCTKVSGDATMSRNIRLGLKYNKVIMAYDAIVLNAHDFWSVGDVIGELTATSKEGIYMANYWRNRNRVPIESTLLAGFTDNGIKIVTEDATAEFIRLFPTVNFSPEEESGWSGTGWAIGNGYLVTNNHVAEGARTIIVKGIGGNYNTGYSAEVVATDKVNDLAILKITDSRFNGYGTLPYGVSPRIADVGEDVFVLGFPLGQFLGDEIKLTSGIINSRTGFGSFQNCYQIQAPITNGNSGGPLFDSKGNVIGIVVGGLNKELDLAENVGYAIKTSYLKILIENVGLNISFTGSNTIANLSRPEKVKQVKNFVYYIECSR